MSRRDTLQDWEFRRDEWDAQEREIPDFDDRPWNPPSDMDDNYASTPHPSVYYGGARVERA